MPDMAVDPAGAGLHRLLFGVDALFLQPPPERRIAQREIARPVLVVEGVVAGGGVVVAPPQLPRVGGQEQGGVAGARGALQHAERHGVVGAPVELVEAEGAVDIPITTTSSTTLAATLAATLATLATAEPRIIRLSHILDAVARSGAKAVREAELARDAGGRQLARRVVDAVDADGGEADGDGGAVAKFASSAATEQGRRRVPGPRVHQRPRHDLVPVEGRAVRVVRP